MRGRRSKKKKSRLKEREREGNEEREIEGLNGLKFESKSKKVEKYLFL